MVVRGTTPQERAAVREENTRARRQGFYVARIRDEAKTARQKLTFACDFAKAVGDDLDEDGRFRLAGAIAKLAEEANRR
jgi:hypothetical protein